MAIIERVEKFDFSNVKFDTLDTPKNYSKGFLLKIQLKDFPINNQRKTIVACPYFSVYSVRLHIEEDKDLFTRLESSDAIENYADENGYIYLLEIEAGFQSPYKKEMSETQVELVLNLFDATIKPAYAYFDGVKLGWVYDKEERNCDYIFGSLICKEDSRLYVENDLDVAVSLNLPQLKKEIIEKRTEKSINFYSPYGYNTWAGDVMNFCHNGVYHLLYLHDRHHHASRWGGGAHSVYHLTTKDFKDWTECPPIVTLEENWQSVGTGTMFFYKGKYYFSHGWHTSRMVPPEKTASYLINNQVGCKDKIVPVSYIELKEKGLYPSGANYLISDDGIHFERENFVFHTSENPSVYGSENNSLFMFGGYGSSGIWRAENIEDTWTLDTYAEVPQSELRPSTECPSMFMLNGYKYLIMGFKGYWRTDKDGDYYHDQAIKGFDIYDGLSVPMVSKTDDNRLILAGWLDGAGWASVIVHRELLQDENGRLYMKWLKELSPNSDELKLITNDNTSITLDERQSYYFEWEVNANQDTQTVVRFSGNKNAVLIIDSRRKIVQINDSEEEILPLYELVKQETHEIKTDKIHNNGINFAIGKVDTIQKPYKVKLQIYYEKKLDSVIVDCEIGEKRTIISNRVRQRFSKIEFTAKNGEIKGLLAYEL